MSGFCAICTAEGETFTMLALGKGGALVRVCNGCRDDHPYTFNGGRAAISPGFAGSGHQTPRRGPGGRRS